MRSPGYVISLKFVMQIQKPFLFVSKPKLKQPTSSNPSIHSRANTVTNHKMWIAAVQTPPHPAPNGFDIIKAYLI